MDENQNGNPTPEPKAPAKTEEKHHRIPHGQTLTARFPVNKMALKLAAQIDDARMQLDIVNDSKREIGVTVQVNDEGCIRVTLTESRAIILPFELPRK